MCVDKLRRAKNISKVDLHVSTAIMNSKWSRTITLMHSLLRFVRLSSSEVGWKHTFQNIRFKLKFIETMRT